MRFFSSIFVTLVVFGCFIGGILGGPQPSIQRTVKNSELVGTWKATTDSAARQDAFMMENPDWGAMDPFRTVSLNADGTCSISIESAWLGNQGASVSPTANAGAEESRPCNWEQASLYGVENQTYPGIVIKVGMAGLDQGQYRLFITEDNSSLELWNFIGDPDSLTMLTFRKSLP